MPLSSIRDILMNDVNRGCLDEKVVQALFQMINIGEIQKIFE